MWLSKFWSSVSPIEHRLRTVLPDEIESVERFQKAIERERFRSDRNGFPFSLLTFEVIDGEGQVLVEAEFIKRLTKRVRATDIVGWFDERHLAVLLPETSEEGAQALATDIDKRLVQTGKVPPCRIYTYPDRLLAHLGVTATGNGASRGANGVDGGQSVHTAVVDGGDHIVANNRCDCIVHGLGSFFNVRIPWWKRTMDVVLSSVGLLLTAPIMAVLALLIKGVSPGPVLFKQERVGYGGKVFNLYKFRTMHTGVDNSEHRKYMSRLIEGDVPMAKLDGGRDPRIIPCGRFIRKSCLDELPQLFNVLKGDMSLIGPRPCLPYEAEKFLRWHARRFDVVPGITGWWQVNGKNKTTFKEMIRYDIEYSNKLSVWMDIKILVKTIPAVLSMMFETPLTNVGGRDSGSCHPSVSTEQASSIH